MAPKKKSTTEDQAAEATEPQAQEDTAASVNDNTDDDDGDDFGADLESMYAEAADTADVDGERGERAEGESEDSEPAGTTDEPSEEEPRDSGEAPAEPEDTTQAAQPETQPQEPAAEQPAPQYPEQQLDPQQVVQQYQEWRGQAEELLAQSHYALTEEQATELENEPAKAIPRLAARLHMEVLQQAVASAMRVIPTMMQQVNQVESTQQAREAEFFSEWPELQPHRADVLRFGEAYLQVNPTATFEDFKRDVGAQVAVARRVDLSARQAAAQGNGQAEQARPQPPQRPLSARAGGAQAPAPSTNPFAQLDEQFEQFEEDL